MIARVLTGLILAPLVVWLFLEGPLELRAGVLALAAVICLLELTAMTLPDHALDRWVAVAVGAAVVIAGYLRGSMHPIDFAGVLLLPAVAVLIQPQPLERAGYRLFVAWAGIVYIALPLSFAIQLALAPSPWILYALTAIWAGDTAAYFAGRFLGRHKLHPVASPKKTIEGALGGLAGSVGGGLAMVAILELPMDLLTAALIALGGGFVAQVGDLAESLIKRSAGAKDSGKLLPGHGGMLDRIDGVIFALPLFYALIPLGG